MFDSRLGWLLTKAMVRDADAVVDTRDDDGASERDGAFRSSRIRADVGVELYGCGRLPGLSV